MEVASYAGWFVSMETTVKMDELGKPLYIPYGYIKPLSKWLNGFYGYGVYIYIFIIIYPLVMTNIAMV